VRVIQVSVCLSVTRLHPVKTDARIEVLFEVGSLWRPRITAQGGGHDLPTERAEVHEVRAKWCL